MSRFKKYLKSAVDEKAPDKWDAIEKAAKENMPRAQKRNFASRFVHSPAALVACAVVIISAVFFAPRIEKIWNPEDSTQNTYVSETTGGDSPDNTLQTTADTAQTSEASQNYTYPTTTTAAHTVASTSAEVTSTAASLIYEERRAEFTNKYGSFCVEYRYYLSPKKAPEITGMEILTGSEFMVPAIITADDAEIPVPSEIYIKNSTGTALKCLYFEEGIEEIYACVSDGAESIYIPASLKNIEPPHMTTEKSVFFADDLKSIKVSDENKAYRSINGVLFSADGETLVRFPAAYESKSYAMPSGTTTIEKYAFYGATLDSLTVPKSVPSIYLENVRISTLYLPKMSTEVICKEDAIVEKTVFAKG